MGKDVTRNKEKIEKEVRSVFDSNCLLGSWVCKDRPQDTNSNITT